MKKCLKILVPTLLIGFFSWSMFSATGVNAKADLPSSFDNVPESIDMSNCPNSETLHFYSTGNTYIRRIRDTDITWVEGRFYKEDGSYDSDCAPDTHSGLRVSSISSTEQGLYYFDSSAKKYFPCDHTPSPTPATSSAEPSYHEHSWTHGVIYEATETTDGLEGDMCSCGAVQNTSPISAFGFACSEAEKKLNNYEQIPVGADYVLDMGRWNSFPREYMESIASRSDVNLTIKFEYNHKKYEIYIPAGTVVDTSLEWYGPLKLMEMFEYKELN